MKYLVPLATAVAVASAPVAAAPIELTLEYDVSVFGLAPSGDFSTDDAGGFTFPDVGNPFTEYDEAATNAELQDLFGNSEPFGGATFDTDTNNWLLEDETLWEFDQLRATFSVDTSDFDRANVVGANVNADINTYVGATIELIKDGSVVQTLSPNYSTVAGDNVDINGTPGDLIAFSTDVGPITDFDFAFGDLTPLEGNTQFQDLDDPDGNALLDLALRSWSGIFEYNEEISGFDGTPIGRYFVQGSLQAIGGSGEQEATPLLPDVADASGGGDPVDPADPPTYDFSVEVATPTEDDFADAQALAEELGELVNNFVPTPVIWIDPIVAIGYVYTIENADQDGDLQDIASLTAPDRDFVDIGEGNLYTITWMEGTEEKSATIEMGEKIVFPLGVKEVQLTGIPLELMLDPTDPTLFRTGIQPGFVTSSNLRLTQTAIPGEIHEIAPIPLPLPAAMLLAGLGGLMLVRRKRA